MMFPMVHGLAKGPETLFQIIQGAELTTNLKLSLDVGDVLSYSGTGQSWLDRSGAGTDFFRGVDVNASTDDPTFNGNAGGLTASEFWGFDGGDFFRYDAANEAWMNGLHKDNALFTLMTIYFKSGTGTPRGFMGTEAGNGDNDGIDWTIATGEKQQFISSKSAAGNALVAGPTDNAVGDSAWHMLALTIDESTGSGGGFFYKDGAFDQVGSADTFDATYATPDTDDATHVMEIGAIGNSSSPLVNGERMACFAAWSGRALTKVELDLIWDRIRGRFGL